MEARAGKQQFVAARALVRGAVEIDVEQTFRKTVRAPAKTVGTAAGVICRALLGGRGRLAGSEQKGGRNRRQQRNSHEFFPVDTLSLKFKQENGCITAPSI
jgi:hypothetical protein